MNRTHYNNNTAPKRSLQTAAVAPTPSTAEPPARSAASIDYPLSLQLAALWLSRQSDAGAARVVRELQVDELQLAQWRANARLARGLQRDDGCSED